MKPERLTCLTVDYPPMKGGVARYLSELTKASKGQMRVLVPIEHPDMKSTPTPPLTRRGLSFPLSKGAEGDFGHVRFWWSGWPRWLPLIKRCLEVKEGMILVSHVVPVGTAAWIAYAFGGPPYAVLFHGTDIQRMKTRWKRWLLRRICGNAAKLIVNSQATAKALQNLVPGADPLVLTPGVALFCHPEPTEGSGPNQIPRLVQLARDDIRKKYDIPQDAKVILTVCRLVERKGTDVLIQAAAKLLETRSDLRLVVVGKGPYAQPLHQLAELMDVPVTWVEDADDEQVKQWYAAADIFCLPAREEPDDVEGFGIVLLEAAAAGLPVVAGSGWGTQEAVQDGVTGLLVQPSVEPVASALLDLLDDPALRKKMGEAGRVRAERDFRWEDRWIKLVASLDPKLRINNEELTITDTERDIAVVIPCYNHADELERTLRALADQALLPKEVVVVDDCSVDNPERVVERFKDLLPIKYQRMPFNQGAPAARNKGADMTSAQFLMFLDADAILVPRALYILRRKLGECPDAAFVYSNFYWGRKLFYGREWDPVGLKRVNWIHTSSLIRRPDFPGFDQSLKKFQDWDLWLTMAERDKSGVWVDEALFRVTERKTGMSRWLPAFMHRLPWPILGWLPDEIRRYREAEGVIRSKHGI